MFGWAALFTLTFLTLAVAMAVARRVRLASRAETALVAALVFHALLATPVLVLGYTSALRPATLALASLALNAVVLALAARGRGPVATFRDALAALGDTARLPVEALVSGVRARNPLVVAVGAAAALVAWLLWLTWISPEDSWDGLFYHQSIVGYALQEHGFRPVPLPHNLVVQQTNGYPRLCEAVSVWFVAFTGRSLIELPNAMSAISLALVVYVITRRHSERLSAAAWSCVILFMPTVWTQLQTTLIDVQVAVFTGAAIAFATQSPFRVRDAVLAAFATALVAGSKFTAAYWVPVILGLVLVRLLVLHGRRRRRDVALAIVAGLAMLLFFALPQPLYNWHNLRNPAWPIAFDSARLGIHWPGTVHLDDFPRPELSQLADRHYAPPATGFNEFQQRDYGYAVPWILLPGAALGALSAVVSAIRGVLRGEPAGPATSIAFVLVAGLLSVWASPTLESARYCIHIVIVLIALASWLESRLRPRELLLACSVALSLVPFLWGKGWYLSRQITNARALLAAPPLERDGMYLVEVSAEFGRRREREIGPGDRVVFTQEILTPSLLWNQHFTNHVAFVKFTGEGAFFADPEVAAAKWICVGQGSEAERSLVARPAEWTALGSASPTIDHGVVYARAARTE